MPATRQAHIQVEALEPAVWERQVRKSSQGGIWQQHMRAGLRSIVDIVISPETALATLRERKA